MTIPKLEGSNSLTQFKLTDRIKKRFNRNFTFYEHALINSLKREKVDCVLAEYGPTACKNLKVVEFLKLPLVVHFFGYDASVVSVLKEYAEQYKKLFSYSNAVVVVSKKMKDDLLALGCPADKLVISTCGPDPIFFELKPSYKKKQFIAVGRFIEKKAPYLTILAFKKVADLYPDSKLIMVGDGELTGICKNLIKALNLTNNIELKGVLTPQEVQVLFEESIAFVQHSVVAESGDSEGTPVAVLDAQAASLPVISTYHAGIPDVIMNNETGLLVEECDVDGMSKNMLRALEEEGLAQKLGTAGKKRVMALFSLEKHLRILEKLIEEICN